MLSRQVAGGYGEVWADLAAGKTSVFVWEGCVAHVSPAVTIRGRHLPPDDPEVATAATPMRLLLVEPRGDGFGARWSWTDLRRPLPDPMDASGEELLGLTKVLGRCRAAMKAARA